MRATDEEPRLHILMADARGHAGVLLRLPAKTGLRLYGSGCHLPGPRLFH